MNFIEESENLLNELKKDIKVIEKYIQSVEDDNTCIDTITLETIIENLIDNANSLYVLTNPEY